MPEPAVRAAALRAICVRYGLSGVSPLDPLPDEAAAMALDPASIARRNEEHIRRCDAVIANITPFRGPGADAGTVYEIGFARALGRPVFGWSYTGADHGARVRAVTGSGAVRDADGLEIEDFGLAENLMVVCGIEASGGFVLTAEVVERWRDLSVFERCVARAAGVLRVV